MVSIGAVYLDDCRRERFIPIYLIVSGCFAIMAALSDIFQRCIFKQEHQQVQPDGRIRVNPIDCLVNTFLFAWFIAGNVWIYRAYNSIDFVDTDSPLYCHPVLYNFAFWLMTVSYILLAIALCCCCCCCCAKLTCDAADKKKKGRDVVA